MQFLTLLTALTFIFSPTNTQAFTDYIKMDYSYLIETIEEYKDIPWSIN